MPADRSKRSARAGPSTTKPRAKKYALPPIVGAGDEADVHAAPAVAVGAVAELEEDEDEDEDVEIDGEDVEEEDSVSDGVEEERRGPAPRPKKKRKSAGIVYISRLPPGMTPHKVRHLMAKWGEVGRVYAQRRDGMFSPLVLMC